MEQTTSSKIIYSEEVKQLVSGIQSKQPDIQCWAVGSLRSLLHVESRPFHYEHNYDETKDHPILVLHSSGSTGLPKPVTMTHASFAVIDNDRNFPSIPGRRNHDLTIWDFPDHDARIYEPFPPFHLAGFFNKVTVPLFTHTIPVFGPPSRPPSGALVAEIMQHQKLRGLFLPPVVAEQLLHEASGLEYFRGLDVFCYAGGPLSQAAGDVISTVTTVCQFYGSTELGQIRQLVPERGEWSYMEFHPLSKLEFQRAEDDAYELVVFAGPNTKGESALNHNYPGIAEWRTRDLFRPHPTKKGLWRFYGRRDDIIVLSSGEKLNPVPSETNLQRHPCIAGALIVGEGRSRPALLLELKSDPGEWPEFLEQIWPVVQEENLKSPSHGRVAKSLILITGQDRPFVRAAKGTIVRRLTESTFKKDIDNIYGRGLESASDTSKSISLRAPKFAFAAVCDFTRSALRQVLPIAELHDNDNVYSFGLDSLKTGEFVNLIRASLGAHRSPQELSWITSETVYRHPTVSELSREILAYLNEGKITKPIPREVSMSTVLQELVNGLSTSVQRCETFPTDVGLSLILTGSTGWLGIHLLEVLASEPGVSHIRCLNRSAEAYQQWQAHVRTRTRALQIKARLTFLTVDHSQNLLGLSEGEIDGIKSESDVILHNAWKVDFNQPLSVFTDNLRSVQSLANLSACSPRRPRIVFISSISSCGPWGNLIHQGTTISEAAVKDLTAALDIGYAESKMISERLLDAASGKQQIPISIMRLGQIAGPTTNEQSTWPERDIIIAMIKTSRTISMLPGDLPDVDWIPIDKLARTIVDITVYTSESREPLVSYFNIVNPNSVPWHEFLLPLGEFCGSNAQVVPLAEWIEKLQTVDGRDIGNLKSMPALRTLQFFSNLAQRGPVAKYSTAASQKASTTMSNLDPITADQMRIWLQQVDVSEHG